MASNSKQLSNPFSTGNGGPYFEAQIQAGFVALLLTGGFAPCLPCWPINKIKLQGKHAGFETDDLIVFTEKPDSQQQRKIFGQIKHTISITENDKIFGEVIQAAWNDFNNGSLFTKNQDVFALITGPLSATDTNDVRTILEWARHAESADEFIKNVVLAKFSSDQKRDKLKAFETNLCKAHGGSPVSKEIFFEFLKHFHLLGYDLDIKTGVTLSLLNSLMGQYTQENTQHLWSRLVNEVQSANQNAGTITRERLPEELQEAFKQRTQTAIPAEFLASQLLPATKTDWNQHTYATDLAIANLVGGWDEKNKADLKILSQLIKGDYGTWISKIREFLQQPDSPITLNNGLWYITERKDLWTTLSPRLFDSDLDIFQQCIVTILTERDPQFDLPTNERYQAPIYDKVLAHSITLRKGMAESLALIGSQPKLLIHCSTNKPASTAISTVRKIFESADWMLWGSLDPLLSTIAEAAPDEFLYVIEKALQQTPCAFDELFLQEGDGVTGGIYHAGLLRALEALAWDEKLLVRASICLGNLTSHDPGGKWSNRPARSLSRIFLPWLPQTIAPIDKRKTALKTLQKETPAVAWKLLLSLLPSPHQISDGTHKPLWRNTIPDDWKKEVTDQDYWEQVSFYAELAVSMASHDMEKLEELIDHLENLPSPSFDNLLEHLSSESICNKPEEERLQLWNGLNAVIWKHKQFSNASWAASPDIVSKLESVSQKLAPQNPLNLNRGLFGGRHGFDLYETEKTFAEQQQLREERRRQAIKDILVEGGIDSVIKFAESVESPMQVGISLGAIAETKIDNNLLPEFLDTKNTKLAQFTYGYVSGRQFRHGWAWVDELDNAAWSMTQKAQFLSYLPYTNETWNRVSTWLGESEKAYWSMTYADAYDANSDIKAAVDKLIEHGRPNAAIAGLYKMLHDKQLLDKSLSIKALLAAASSTESSSMMDTYYIVELIKALQDDIDTDPDDLFQIEWIYLPLLHRQNGGAPKMLESRLASDPTFFCEVIRCLYNSTHEKLSQKEPSEQEKSLADNAWWLVHEWRTPPGMQTDRTFLQEKFAQWLEQTKQLCQASGHIEFALHHVGQVLIYCPTDPEGLWINKSVAEALNAEDAEKMRNGFQSGIISSRGVHYVNPTGEPERKLAEKYREMAEAVEDAGYQRFAVTLKNLADTYDYDADRIVDEYQYFTNSFGNENDTA